MKFHGLFSTYKVLVLRIYLIIYTSSHLLVSAIIGAKGKKEESHIKEIDLHVI